MSDTLLESMSEEPVELAKCYLCERKVSKEDFECAGCGQIICDNHPSDPWGEHEPQDHN